MLNPRIISFFFKYLSTLTNQLKIFFCGKLFLKFHVIYFYHNLQYILNSSS